MERIARLFAATLLGALLLSGCTGGFLLDNQVQAFSSLTALPAQPTYRFERLPSQAQDPNHAHIEAMADPALHKAGLRRDDSAPRFSVQVAGSAQRVLSPYADPWDHGGFGFGGRGIGFGFGRPFGRMESPWFTRQVSVIVRDLPTNKVVFESHANNDGPWLDNRSVLPVMFEAALQGFPNPPPGPRRVDIHVGAR